MRKRLGSDPGLHVEMADRGYYFARNLATQAVGLVKRGRCAEGQRTFEDAVYYLGKADAQAWSVAGDRPSGKLLKEQRQADKVIAKARKTVHKACSR